MAHFEIKVTLTKEQVFDAISLYMRQNGLLVERVDFNVRDTSDDRWGGPSYEFTNATVKVAPIDKSMSYSSLGSQIESVERGGMGDR